MLVRRVRVTPNWRPTHGPTLNDDGRAYSQHDTSISRACGPSVFSCFVKSNGEKTRDPARSRSSFPYGLSTVDTRAHDTSAPHAPGPVRRRRFAASADAKPPPLYGLALAPAAAAVAAAATALLAAPCTLADSGPNADPDHHCTLSGRWGRARQHRAPGG